MRERGIAPLVVLVAAAIAALVGVVTLAKTQNTSVNNLVQTILQPAPKTIPQSVTYSVQGTSVKSTILVRFKDGVSDLDSDSVHKQFGTKVKDHITGIKVQEVEIPEGSSVTDYINSFKGRPEVKYAEPNFAVKNFLIPNDPYFSNQWNLQKINAPAAWDKSQGGFGPIAIIDTGIDKNHPDLAGEVVGGYNFLTGTTDTTDDNGHGTHVAGIIEAATNNGTGVASIGYKGTLMPIKILDASGTGNAADLASAIIYAADNGAKIINLSLGGSSYSQTEQDAVNYAIGKGVIIVAAAGNNGNSSLVYPAADQGVLAVSATDASDNLAGFSSFGSDIFLSAPGTDINSSYLNGGYALMSGTSMSAPHVAGLLALAYSYPGTTATTIFDAIKKTSDKIGQYPYDQNGWNQYFGYGRINAGNLLAFLSAPTPTPTPVPQVTMPTPTPTPTPITIATPRPTPGPSFDVDLEGTVDGIDLADSKISVNISGISQNVAVTSNNLVYLFINQSTKVSSNGNSTSIASLTNGQKINAKALWQSNKLTATEINIQKPSENAPVNQPTPGSSPAGDTDNKENSRIEKEDEKRPSNFNRFRVKGISTETNSLIELIISGISNLLKNR